MQPIRTSAGRSYAGWGAVALMSALVLAVSGWGLVVVEAGRIPVRQTTIDGLLARLNDARWLVDQMDHGEGFARPRVMMPGMPEPGSQRLRVDLTFQNKKPHGSAYRGEEFTLVSDLGPEYPPVGAQLGGSILGAGQALHTALYFDFNADRDTGNLRLRWRRGSTTRYMPISHPPEHYHGRPRGNVTWPDQVEVLMPIANADQGALLYAEVYGCGACHGDPKRPGSNALGPHLGRIGSQAASRVPNQSARQYLYEAILRPDNFISPECKNGRPCAVPSAMPDYSGILDIQAMADLIAYLERQM